MKYILGIIILILLGGGIYYYSQQEHHYEGDGHEHHYEGDGHDHDSDDHDSEDHNDDHHNDEDHHHHDDDEEDTQTDDSVASDDGYSINYDASAVNWTGKKPTASHAGSLKFNGGAITEDLVGSLFVVDMTSIDYQSERLVDHLENADFFDVETYPDAQLLVTAYDGTTMTGDLTIKDVTAEITAPAMVAVTDTTIEISSSFSIDRTVWGITYGSGSFFDNLGDNLIDDQVDLEVTVIGTRE